MPQLGEELSSVGDNVRRGQRPSEEQAVWPECTLNTRSSEASRAGAKTCTHRSACLPACLGFTLTTVGNGEGGELIEVSGARVKPRLFRDSTPSA